jgi:hypothetical protein
LVKEKLDNGELEELSLNDFEAPVVTTYLIYRQSYDVKQFLENRFDSTQL